MEPTKMVRIINQRRYSTETATLIAHDNYWNGHKCEQRGRNKFLYRTDKGNYFLVTQTMWVGEQNTLAPISQQEAVELYESELPVHEVSYGKAFPEIVVVEA